MVLELIDTHVHLDAPDFDNDRDEVISRAIAAGITRLVTIGAGYGIESAGRAVELTKKYENVWASVGVHPHDSKVEPQIEPLRNLALQPKVVAIGETGLDFYRDWAPVELQEKWFRAQIELAKEVKKPLIIHCRDAAEQCYAILKETGASSVGGVFHCYAEDAPFAVRLSEINFMVSIPGSLTFKKAEKMREAVREIPIEQIMLETDGPYLAPEPKRGKRCESSFMVETAKKLAEIKGISLEETAKITSDNAVKFFKLQP